MGVDCKSLLACAKFLANISDLLLLSSGVPSFEAMGGIEEFLKLPLCS